MGGWVIDPLCLVAVAVVGMALIVMLGVEWL